MGSCNPDEWDCWPGPFSTPFAYILPTVSPPLTSQIFDSWGGQLPPREWDRWSGPYLKRIVQQVKATHPTVPLTLYANGSGGLLERIKSTGVDVVGIDWTVDMGDARRRLGNDVSLQGNVDPTILFASHVSRCFDRGGRSHVSLGAGKQPLCAPVCALVEA